MSGWDRIARTSAETRGVVAALSVLVLFLVLAAFVGNDPEPPSDLPDGVPSGLVEPLQELHDAVASESVGEQVPGLARKLERVDAAVVDGRYDRARAVIGSLAALAARARVADELSADETERILDAAQELVEQLPEDDEGCCPREDDAGRAGTQSGS